MMSICFHGDAVDWVIKLIRDGKCEGEKPTTVKDPVETVRPIDCGDINQNHGNGVYKIYPKKSKTGFQVFCDFKTDGAGWTVFHTRLNGKTDFFRGWKAYEEGFGDIQHEFWQGNRKLSQITTQAKYELRIDMEDISEKKGYAKYTNFLVEDASMNYSSIVRDYSGDAGR
ncbi:Hypothetical predicted protein [Mytilus galloprovincialis]|uniref:Fibrinogen C-terminal domain-containing protein n=1 Tax=Mytilus galloprovincialis TaxID=29158 RepID=A0A8B6D004_MYTGA|nr:Hypothetical predicted protein [Mytilus galloprovincialis]